MKLPTLSPARAVYKRRPYYKSLWLSCKHGTVLALPGASIALRVRPGPEGAGGRLPRLPVLEDGTSVRHLQAEGVFEVLLAGGHLLDAVEMAVWGKTAGPDRGKVMPEGIPVQIAQGGGDLRKAPVIPAILFFQDSRDLNGCHGLDLYQVVTDSPPQVLASAQPELPATFRKPGQEV